MTYPAASPRTAELEDALAVATADRRLHGWLVALAVGVALVAVGLVAASVWVGVATADPGGPDYAGLVVLLLLAGGAVGLFGVGGALWPALNLWYWHDGRFESPGRRAARLGRELARSRQLDVDRFLRDLDGGAG